jgi:hypothetical protein|tara:strand:- start:1507 stop:1644 length:138 start_codon:yes stop_codon:yes gene_type:complete
VTRFGKKQHFPQTTTSTTDNALLGILEKITGKDQTPEASLDLEGH